MEYSQSSHVSFFCGGDPFCEVVRRPENTHEELTGLLERPAGSLPLVWATSRSLPSVQNYRPYTVFLSPMRKYEHPLHITYFSVYGWLSGLTFFPFFPEICLRTEISVTLSTGNKLYSCHHILYFSFLWKHFVDVISRPPWIC